MENGLYVGLSRESALMQAMQVVSNNIANASTTGYRGQNPLFKEMIEKPGEKTDPLSFVADYGQYDNTSAGPVSLTGGTYDVALEGPGFFGVQNAGVLTRKLVLGMWDWTICRSDCGCDETERSVLNCRCCDGPGYAHRICARCFGKRRMT